MSITEKTIDLGGPVNYVDFGGEGPPMVLVHGLGGAAVNWYAVGEELAKDHRVLALDLPGFGRTPLAGRAATLTNNRDLVERFVDATCDAPPILVGNSMGGLISLALAATRASKVSGLVLVNAALPRPPKGRPDPLVLATFLAYMVPGLGELFMSQRARRVSAEAQARQMLNLCTVDRTRIPRHVEEAHYELARARRDMPWSNEAFLTAARSIVPLVLRPGAVHRWVSDVRAPTLVMHGTHDRLIPIGSSREVHRRRPDFTLEIFDDIGHVPQLESPERFVESLRRWRSGQAASSSQELLRRPSGSTRVGMTGPALRAGARDRRS